MLRAVIADERIESGRDPAIVPFRSNHVDPPQMTVWRIDLHCHTSRSYDGWTTPTELVRRARAAALDRICVTDHGNMRGALEASRIDTELVIPGQEIRCATGIELIGIGLSEPVAEGRSVSETAAMIREQGALVYAPHPFAYARHGSLRAALSIEAADIVEVFNPRAFLPSWNRDAADAAARAGKAMAASSDAHFPWEIGRSYTEVQPFETISELATRIRSGRPVHDSRTSWSCHLLSVSLGGTRRLTAATVRREATRMKS